MIEREREREKGGRRQKRLQPEALDGLCAPWRTSFSPGSFRKSEHVRTYVRKRLSFSSRSPVHWATTTYLLAGTRPMLCRFTSAKCITCFTETYRRPRPCKHFSKILLTFSPDFEKLCFFARGVFLKHFFSFFFFFFLMAESLNFFLCTFYLFFLFIVASLDHLCGLLATWTKSHNLL